MRLADPVALVGKHHQLGRDLLELERGEELQSLPVGHAEIQFAARDQGGRVEGLGIGAGREAGVEVGVL